jgi:hypothetical protein
VQLHPIKPTLKAPGTVRSKLKYDKQLSSFVFKLRFQIQLAPLHRGGGGVQRDRGVPRHRGKAVQVDSIKIRFETAYVISA